MDTKVRVPDFGGLLTNHRSVISLYHHNNINRVNHNSNSYGNEIGLGHCLGTTIEPKTKAIISTKTTKATKTIPLATPSSSSSLKSSVDTTAISGFVNTIDAIPRSSSTSSSSSTLSAIHNGTTSLSSSLLSTVSSSSSPPSSSSSTSTTTGKTSSTGTVKQVTIGGNSHNYIIPSDILDDLASRFIINVPDDERNNLIRICFHIELAHWFYLDFFCSIEDKKLLPCGMKQFAMLLFQHIPFLRAHLSGIDKILEDWKEYKFSVPTYGAILVSEDLKHVLLVQSYRAKSSWGFPKGKVNENEDPVHCAAREVYEETGYDINELIVPNDYFEAVINYQYTRLYLVQNVPLETIFSPRTRNEIKCIEWFPVDSLPTNKNDVISKQNLGINANSFFMIMPFIKRLKKWVQDNRCIRIKSSSTTAVIIPSSPILSAGLNGITTTTISSAIIIPSINKYNNTSNNNNGINCNGITSPSTLSTTNTTSTTLSMNTSSSNGAGGGILGNNMNRKNNKDSKLSQNNLVNNNISALNISGNSYKQNNNNNFPRCKTQRHKSMGDIDGIKLNFNVYNTNSYYSNNNIDSKYYNNNNNNGTKLNTTQNLNQQQQQPQQQQKQVAMATLSTATVTTTTTADKTVSSLSTLSSTMNDSPLSSILSTLPNSSATSTSTSSSVTTVNNYNNNNNYKREKYNKTNFNKRQNCNGNNSVTNSHGTGNSLGNNNNNSNTNNLINSNNHNNKNNKNILNGTKSSNSSNNNSINHNQLNNVRSQQPQQLSSKKLQQPQQQKNHFIEPNKKINKKLDNQNNKEKQQQQLQQQKVSNKKSIYNPNHFVKIPPPTKSDQKFNINDDDDAIKKLSPEFDSWTSFTFTKNFISNVFC